VQRDELPAALDTDSPPIPDVSPSSTDQADLPLTGQGGPGVIESSSLGATVEEATPPPVFVEYEVQPGDTVIGIAELFGIGTDYILWNNVDVIEEADSLAIGAVLQVPGVEGIIHSARLGDTASDLAVEYDSTTEAIVQYEANGFGGNPDNLPVGALILVPGGRRFPPPEEVSPVAPPEVLPPPVPVPSWAWPATGRLTNVFSPRHPLGIDISMVVGTPLAAAMSGQVVFVGGSACCSYGYHVIIEHADGYETLYAHLSEVYVANGQWVTVGEIIGRSGNTGYSTGPHLHFEIRRNGVYRDPLAYLP
jgi:murein DD-endopeptidase MepM/ murein hydrolase activator NlpD